MPRAEPLNEKITQALKSRQRRAELLCQQQQFHYGRAIRLITQYRGNITQIAQIERWDSQAQANVQLHSNSKLHEFLLKMFGLAPSVSEMEVTTNMAYWWSLINP